ncbi:annexin A1-like [Sinocyclocheilus rhinocerous]|uniref:annexin A1-like n=1 Tax=Sinocyclocheilus rhinocerous TaxID=307959 RepID=UPI0007B82DE5|nr:PREDICTED: annexin A1-like [Sinocyclocheilus rhinocerous]
MAFFKKLFEQQNDDKGFKPAPFETGYFGTVKADPNFNAQNDAAKLKKAIETKGVDEATVVEVIAKRSNAQRQQIKAAYQQSAGKDLAADLKKALKSEFEEVVLALLMTPPEYDAFEMKRAMKALFEAGENRIGTVCSVLIDILTNRSEAQLCKILQYYGQFSKDGLAKDLEGELSGNFEDCLMTLVKGAWNKHAYFAERLKLAMKGLGTDTDTLTRIIVSRSEIDLLKIMQEYKRMYGKSLQEDLLKETKGDYEKIMLALCGTP